MTLRHWTLLGEAPIPGTNRTLLLYQGKDDFSIKISGGHELMNTRKHGSEDALGILPCRRMRHPDTARVLIGGVDFSKLAFNLQEATINAPAVVISYGKFIQTLVDFTIIAAVIFIVIKGINSLKKNAEKAAAAPAAPPAQEVLLTEIRDLLKK